MGVVESVWRKSPVILPPLSRSRSSNPWMVSGYLPSDEGELVGHGNAVPDTIRIRPSRFAGRNSATRDGFNQRAKRAIDVRRVLKHRSYVGIEEHDIGALAIASHVLSPNAAPEVVVGPHSVLVNGAVSFLLHRFVSHHGWRVAR